MGIRRESLIGAHLYFHDSPFERVRAAQLTFSALLPARYHHHQALLLGTRRKLAHRFIAFLESNFLKLLLESLTQQRCDICMTTRIQFFGRQVHRITDAQQGISFSAKEGVPGRIEEKPTAMGMSHISLAQPSCSS